MKKSIKDFFLIEIKKCELIYSTEQTAAPLSRFHSQNNILLGNKIK